ncbi:MAG TPA: ArsC family transcriptional regulator [Ruminococcus sp.]|jgi:arsenate reductase-like glutaredoxin family protein|nr:ArsC family transcriptional regulator [Ruminococcus sp.]
MNIQIFGTKKCQDTRKAERYFKERNIKYQFIDMKEKGMSRGEFNSIKNSVGGIDCMINEKCKDTQLVTLMKYLSDSDKEEKLFENQQAVRTPVVRNGKTASVGYCPDIWKEWK